MSRALTARLLRLIALILLVGALIGVTLAAAQEASDTYTIVLGDTLEAIARRFDVSLEALLQANRLTRISLIFPGNVIAIPQDAPPYGFAPPGVNLQNEQSRADNAAGRLYVLQLGDALDLIAVYYNVSLACILDSNDIANPQRLAPGTVVFIPATCPPYAGLSTLGRALGYEIGRERAVRPPTTASAQTPLVVQLPGA